jgi:hypothetical protein
MKKLLVAVLIAGLMSIAGAAMATDDNNNDGECTVNCNGAYYEQGWFNINTEAKAGAEGKWTETFAGTQFLGRMTIGDENTQNFANMEIMGGALSEDYGPDYSFSGAGAHGWGSFEFYNRW